jgi:hypothetical protein
MNSKSVIATTLFTLGLATARAAVATDLWLHVRVLDAVEGSKVNLNLPFSLLESSAPMIAGELHGEDRLRLDGQDLKLADLRKIWAEIESGPDANYVTVDGSDGKVRVAKSGRFLVVEADGLDRGRRAKGTGGEHEKVESRMPLSVVRALLSGGSDHLDLKAGLEALAREGGGELITVSGGHETVRIWIDHEADPAR